MCEYRTNVEIKGQSPRNQFFSFLAPYSFQRLNSSYQTCGQVSLPSVLPSSWGFCFRITMYLSFLCTLQVQERHLLLESLALLRQSGNPWLVFLNDSLLEADGGGHPRHSPRDFADRWEKQSLPPWAIPFSLSLTAFSPHGNCCIGWHPNWTASSEKDNLKADHRKVVCDQRDGGGEEAEEEVRHRLRIGGPAGEHCL